MTPLPPDLRTRLARTIQQARRTAEAGARQSLESLAVHLGRPFHSMPWATGPSETATTGDGLGRR